MSLPEFRSLLIELQHSKEKKLVELASRTLLLLDVATATTAAQRHAAIRRLPVTLSRSLMTDGSQVTTFSARGRVRFRTVTAVNPRPRQDPPHNVGDIPSGPSAVDRRFECYDGGDEPCATTEEMDDLGIYLAELDSENSQNESDYESYDAECSGLEGCYEQPFAAIGGPYVCETNLAGCADKAVNATWAMASTVGGTLLAWARWGGAATEAVTLSAAEVAGWYVTLGGAAFASGYLLAAYIDCVVNHRIVPQHPQPELVFED